MSFEIIAADPFERKLKRFETLVKFKKIGVYILNLILPYPLQ